MEVGKVAIMSKETKKLMATTTPVYGVWYKRFMLGMHERMGDDYRPDLAMSIQLLHAVLTYCNTTYLTADTVEIAKMSQRWGLYYL